MTSAARAIVLAGILLLGTAACGKTGSMPDSAVGPSTPGTRVPAKTTTTERPPTTERLPGITVPPTTVPTATPQRVGNGWIADGITAFSNPTATDDTVFATVDAGGGTIQAVALDAATGKELWHHAEAVAGRIGGMGLDAPQPYKGPNGWGVVVLEETDDGTAYVGHDPRTGKELWTHPVDWSIETAPCGPWACLEHEPDDGPVEYVAVDPRTGDQQWRFAPAGAVGLSELGNTATTAIVTSLGDSPIVYGIDVATGKARWTVAADAQLGAGTSSDYGWNGILTSSVFVVDFGNDTGAPSGMIAIDPETGAVPWHLADTHLPLETLTNTDAPASAGSVSQPGLLLGEDVTITDDTYDVTSISGLDPATGHTLWTKPLALSYADDNGYPESVRSADGRVAWILHPDTDDFIGIDLASGTTVPTEGVGWDVYFQETDDDNGITVGDDSYTPPIVVDQVRLPSLDPLDGSATPPAIFSTTAGPRRAWLDGDGTLHCATP